MNLKKQKEKERRRARKLAEEAWQAVADGNLDLAEKIIRRAVLVQQDNPVFWSDQGAILVLRGKEDEAEKSFRNALRLVPTFAEAYAHLAALRAKRGWLEQAVRLQEKAVTHAPGNAGYLEKLEAYRALAADETLGRPQSPAEAEVASPAPAPPLDLPTVDWPARADVLDWDALGEALTREGCVLIRELMDRETCAGLRGLFERDELFAKTVEMDQPTFGRGMYRYFRPPVPEVVEGLRRAVYPHLARVANRWQELLREAERYPDNWEAFRVVCREAGQTTPTPILLRYGPGGFNALHRDLRGSVFFPIQMAVVLSPRRDQAADGFTGGDFLFRDVPERPKSRRREVAAGLGDAILFCTRDRLVPIGGVHGLQPVKHGVAEITAGTRVVLGVPFHEYR
ncbi:MAG TPA: 2OG-Fe(II) oxygenase [Gemmataceae bacterium]|nr:2OG-Fe(II) oxygenase [Gemmataceae bacterium]